MVQTLILTFLTVIWVWGLTITSVARLAHSYRLSILSVRRHGEDAVVYVHTDGINTNVDVDVEWLTGRSKNR